MEPVAPGTEDDTASVQPTLSKKASDDERLLNIRGYLPNGKHGPVFTKHYNDGMEHWYCNLCECPVMGRMFHHETGKRHTLRMSQTNNSRRRGGGGGYKNEWEEDEEEERMPQATGHSQQRDEMRIMTKDKEELTKKDDDVGLNDEKKIEGDDPSGNSEGKGGQSQIKLAPGEPLPPGAEGEATKVAHIQERLDNFKASALLGLEYLLEIEDYDPNKEPSYLCALCDKKGDPRTVVAHLVSYNHLQQFMQRHFPATYRALSPYITRQYRKNWQDTMNSIAEAIETKYGRLLPHPVDKSTFEKKKDYYYHMIHMGPHFSEKNGVTFEAMVKAEDITKNCDDEPPAKDSDPNKKRSPSPPVVAKPKRPKNALTASSSSDRKVRRTSLSSVSSISSNEITDFDETAGTAAVTSNTSAAAAATTGRNKSRSPEPRNRSPAGKGRSDSLRVGAGRYKREVSPARGKSYTVNRGGGRVVGSRTNNNPSSRSSFRQRSRSRSRSRDRDRDRERPRLPWQRSDYAKTRDGGGERKDKDKDGKRGVATPQESKLEEFRRLATAIENDQQKTLGYHEKNPEKHPQYNEEWKLFWNKRYKELQVEGKDAANYDFKPEWIVFWNKRMKDLHLADVKTKKDALRKRLGLRDEPQPISFRIGKKPPNSSATTEESKSLAPMASQPDQDHEVIIIDDKDDDSDNSRSRSPWESDTVATATSGGNRKTNYKKKLLPAAVKVGKDGKDALTLRYKSRSPNLARNRSKSRSRDRNHKSRSRERFSNRDNRDKSRSRERFINNRDKSRSRERFVSNRDKSRSRERTTNRDKSRSRDCRSNSRMNLKRSRSKSPGGRGNERYYREPDYFDREKSWERVINHHREMRTTKSIPDAYKPPMMMRDVTKEPVFNINGEIIVEEPTDILEDGEINIVSVLRLLTALEDKLGSLGPKVVDLLATALAMEKHEANSSELLLDNEVNCVLFETVKEKLKGQLLARLVPYQQIKAVQHSVTRLASLLHVASERKRLELEKVKAEPVKVAGVGTVDKAAIAKQIATALVLQGKTDVTQAELEQLINAVVGMAEASKKSEEPIMSTASFLTRKLQTNKKPVVVEITPSSSSSSKVVEVEEVNAMDGLSDTDLQTLLQNFKDLSTEEQHGLITYLKKLESKEPDRVEKLRRFVNMGTKLPAAVTTTSTLASEEKTVGGISVKPEVSLFPKDVDERQLPFGAAGNTEVVGSKMMKFDSDDEEEYSYEDVFKAAKKNVKEHEREKERLKAEKTTEINMNEAKAIIANLMGNIAKSSGSGENSSSNEENAHLLGFGGGGGVAAKLVNAVESGSLVNPVSNPVNTGKLLGNSNLVLSTGSNLPSTSGNLVNSALNQQNLLLNLQNSTNQPNLLINQQNPIIQPNLLLNQQNPIRSGQNPVRLNLLDSNLNPRQQFVEPNRNRLNFEPNFESSNRMSLMDGFPEGNRPGIDNNRLNFEPNRMNVNPEENRLNFEPNRATMEQNRINIDPINPNRMNVDQIRMNLEPNRLNLEPNRLNLEPNRLNLEPNRMNLDSNRPNLNSFNYRPQTTGGSQFNNPYNPNFQQTANQFNNPNINNQNPNRFGNNNFNNNNNPRGGFNNNSNNSNNNRGGGGYNNRW